jgi:hypothetical protein
MKRLLITAVLGAIASSAGAMAVDARLQSEAAQPAGFSCEQPVLPSYSTSSEGAHRMEKKVAQWSNCANAFLARSDSADDRATVVAMGQQLALDKGIWLNHTVLYSNGQAMGHLAQVQVERDRASLLRQYYVGRGAPVYVSERPANADLIQLKLSE